MKKIRKSPKFIQTNDGRTFLVTGRINNRFIIGDSKCPDITAYDIPSGYFYGLVDGKVDQLDLMSVSVEYYKQWMPIEPVKTA